MNEALAVVLAASTIRLAVPLMLAGLGELVSEKAGLLNLSLEGMMLAAAFGGALGAFLTGSPLAGLALALLCSCLVAALQGVFSIVLQANQIVSGIGINIAVLGLTTVASRAIFGRDAGFTIAGFAKLPVPGLHDLPFAGPVLFTQSGFVYAAPVVALAIAMLLYRTTPGLALRAAGDEPRAVDKSGASVSGVRWLAVLTTGLAAGLGGAVYSLADIHTFTENMTSGAGYLALAAVIFGRWRVWGTVVACLVFGAASSLQFQLPAIGIDFLPPALLIMMPYVLALLAVSGLVGRQSPPRALTVPFSR
ncbi:MAG: ABC transporter permease [Pseudomonadota bacterium]